MKISEEGTDYQCSDKVFFVWQAVIVNHMTCFMSTLTPLGEGGNQTLEIYQEGI